MKGTVLQIQNPISEASGFVLHTVFKGQIGRMLQAKKFKIFLCKSVEDDSPSSPGPSELSFHGLWSIPIDELISGLRDAAAELYLLMKHNAFIQDSLHSSKAWQFKSQ